MVPVWSTRDKLVRGAWVLALAGLVLTVVMASLGVRANRRDATQPAPDAAISAAPTLKAPDRPKVDPAGAVTFGDLATMKMPTGFETVTRVQGSSGWYSSLVFGVVDGPSKAPSTTILAGYVAPLVAADQRKETARVLIGLGVRRLYADAGEVDVQFGETTDETRWGEAHPAATVTGTVKFTDPQSRKPVTDAVGMTLVQAQVGTWIAIFWIASGQVKPALGEAARKSVESLVFAQ